MASSIPVIATDAGGVLDLFGPEMDRYPAEGFILCERGILCRKNDASGFSKGLKYLTEVGAKEKIERLDRARSFVGNRNSERRLLGDIESLYLELLNEPVEIPERPLIA
jgi:glycosyltransferase involved in cell wall biosynthesis